MRRGGEGRGTASEHGRSVRTKPSVRTKCVILSQCPRIHLNAHSDTYGLAHPQPDQVPRSIHYVLLGMDAGGFLQSGHNYQREMKLKRGRRDIGGINKERRVDSRRHQHWEGS